MIQRIQTLYLLVVAVLLCLMFFIPLFSIDVVLPGVGVEVLKMKPFGMTTTLAGSSAYLFSTPHIGALLVLCLALAVVIIFLYRNRILQIRLCFALMALLLGLQVFVGYYIYRGQTFLTASKEISEASTLPMSYSITDIFPLVCLILVYLAFRGIAKDEVLIKSLNRIR